MISVLALEERNGSTIQYDDGDSCTLILVICEHAFNTDDSCLV